MKMIDISVPITPDMLVWPGSPRTEFQWRRSMAKGDRSNNSNFFMNTHSGTHVDAPLHFFAKGKGVEELSMETMMGSVHLLDFSREKEITVEKLESLWPSSEKVERLLLKTRNSDFWEKRTNEFVENFCALREEQAKWLLQKGIRLIGIDYLSIQCYKDSPIVHQLLLEAEIIIIEGLNLSEVDAGKYDLVCLPLKLVGLEGAPARVLLKDIVGD